MSKNRAEFQDAGETFWYYELRGKRGTVYPIQRNSAAVVLPTPRRSPLFDDTHRVSRALTSFYQNTLSDECVCALRRMPNMPRPSFGSSSPSDCVRLQPNRKQRARSDSLFTAARNQTQP